ncbi:uncharacterized protein LOC115051010 isoform X2 [Echeneis naucrates]|uniref:uncharacterized protein LOC115051010 isoform X2 n=1 Tax=Echeneis naucrates TaxID=173247 RepID=UPI001113C9DE|nr:uncharacterized protein LOC115051010 isoform X2 [Echeneis naucrates]
MEKDRLCCQNCVTTVYRVSCFKKHVHSKAHQQKMRELFQKETHILHTSVQNGYIPSIAVLEPFVKTEMKHHIIGLSLLTFCFSPDKSSSFYLCHVCEEKLPPDKILNHLSSGDHCSNFFNFTDPNVLSFSWIPSMDMRAILKPQITQEYEAKGCGTLQMLDLPDKILTKLENSIYSEVMNTLNENDKLLKHFEATQPKRTLIEAYQKDSNRKHPLLGLQHLVECTCDGPPEKRYYLCTLCGLTLAPHIIIKHVLSFDHIFCYFKAWHPSSLMSKECYDYTEYFTCMIQDFAKQTENIHGNPDMKTMRLKPAEFSSVNFSCFAEALKKLECIRKETTGGSLITSIKPGKKLEYQPVKARSVLVLPKLRCQNCNVTFETLFQYKEHLFQWKHKQMLKKLFGEDEGCNQTVSCSPHLGLYRCFQDGQKQNQPVIGMSLVVVCVCTQVQTETLYVCIGCKDSFPESVLRKHLNSQKHLIKTVLHYNPWLLHFCWEGQVDMTSLKSSACEEEKGRDPSERVLKVFDIPYWKFTSLIPPSYPKVIERLKKYETILKKGVPHCETYRKLRQNERFPILGRSFLVMYVISIRGHEEVAFLCLLCEKKLSDAECYAHDFSKEHVTKFLNSFYPGSLTPSTDAETLLDLATQAACDQGASHLQKIELDTPIREPCSYNRTIAILACAKRKRRGGPLEPTIRPKAKLCPRKSLKKVDKDNRRNNSEESSTTMEGSEKKTGQKSTDNKESVSKTNGAFDETSMSSYKEEQTREFLPETSLEKINNQDKKSSDEMPESCQDTEVSKSFKKVVKSLKGNTCKEDERKRPLSMSEKPQDATGSDEDMGKGVGCKRQRLTSKKYTSWEDSKINPSSGLKEVSTINNGESGKPNHKGVKDKASSGLQLVDSSVSVHTQYEVCSKMDSVQVVVIDDDSESSDTQQCSEPQPMTVMTETTSTKHPRPSNANIKRSNLKIPESATKPNTFLSVARKRKLPEKISRACVVVIDDDSESSDTQQCSEPQPMTVMTETTSTKTVAPKCQTAKRVTFHFGNTANTTKGAIGGTNVAKTLVKGENAEASDVAPFIQKSMPAAQQLMTAKSVNSEHKKPRTEPSHNPTTKPKANENIPKVGLNYLITVTCDGKKQVYCTLCSIKMKESGHLVHFTHKYNYVKLKYPQWTVKLPEEESKLDKIVTHLAEVEKDIGSQMNESIEVSSKEYQALHTFPDNEALEKVKKMVRQKNFQMSSSSSTDLRRQRNLANPDDEMKSNLKEKADDAIPDLSQISSLKNNHDPIPIRGLHNEHTAVEKEQLEPDIEAQAPQSLSPSTMKCQTGQKNVDAQAHVEVTPAVQSPVQGYADPVATQSDSFATFIQSPHLCQEPAGKRQQQEKSNLEIQETEQTPPASVLSSSPDSLSSGFLVSRAESTKQQNLSTSHALENVPKHSEDSPVPVPGQHSVSPAFPTISEEEVRQTCPDIWM